VFFHEWDFPVPRKPRPLATPAIAAGLIALVLAGTACSSSGNSDGTDRSLPTAVPALPSNLPATSAALASLMAHGLTVTASAHLNITATGHALTLHGTGSVALVNGLLTGFDVTSDIAAMHGVRVISVNSVHYALLPNPAQASKPWSPVPASGGSAKVRKVRSAIAATEQLAAPANVLSLVAAGHVGLRGTGKIGTVAAAHYLVTTRVTALPRTAAVRAELIKEGVRSVRLDLWVDGDGRPLSVRNTPTPKGATSGTVLFRSFNRHVAFKAPNAKLVAPGS
jgi:hypothetical protein